MHLASLLRSGLLAAWPELLPGTDLSIELPRRMALSPLILLLVSTDYLEDERCQAEAASAMLLYREARARVIPIRMRPVDFSQAAFAQLASLPADGRPVQGRRVPDQIFVAIAHGIRQVALDIRSHDQTPRVHDAKWSMARASEQRTQKLVSSLSVQPTLGGADELYVTSINWNKALAVHVDLDWRVSDLMTHLMKIFELEEIPAMSLQFGVKLTYHLYHNKLPLDANQSLRAQRVASGDDLWLVTKKELCEEQAVIHREGAAVWLRNGAENLELLAAVDAMLLKHEKYLGVVDSFIDLSDLSI